MAVSLLRSPIVASTIVVDMEREYRRKVVAFGLLVCAILGISIAGHGTALLGAVALLFAMAVDLMGIRRCIRICNSFANPKP